MKSKFNAPQPSHKFTAPEGKSKGILEDYETKKAIFMPHTKGSVLFAGDKSEITQDNSNLFWDDTNKSLGIGTTNTRSQLNVSIGTDLGTTWLSYLHIVGGNSPGSVSLQTYYNNAPYANVSLALQPSAGKVGIGTLTPATSAKLDITSTTGALLLSRMTTAQRNALTAVNGMLIYNSTDNKFQGYENGAWANLI